MQGTLSSEIGQAIGELEAEFPGVIWEPDGQGGAYVTVPGIELGEQWSPRTADLTFQIAFNYPDAAIYPFYLPAPLERFDGSWPQALQLVQWRDRNVIQLSLRANRWQPTVDTALGATIQVQDWFQHE
jgi:hypothetical protein